MSTVFLILPSQHPIMSHFFSRSNTPPCLSRLKLLVNSSMLFGSKPPAKKVLDFWISILSVTTNRCPFMVRTIIPIDGWKWIILNYRVWTDWNIGYTHTSIIPWFFFYLFLGFSIGYTPNSFGFSRLRRRHDPAALPTAKAVCQRPWSRRVSTWGRRPNISSPEGRDRLENRDIARVVMNERYIYNYI